jgi:hypothetical protein
MLHVDSIDSFKKTLISASPVIVEDPALTCSSVPVALKTVANASSNWTILSAKVVEKPVPVIVTKSPPVVEMSVLSPGLVVIAKLSIDDAAVICVLLV